MPGWQEQGDSPSMLTAPAVVLHDGGTSANDITRIKRGRLCNAEGQGSGRQKVRGTKFCAKKTKDQGSGFFCTKKD